jgi:hypothetical protein
MTAVWAPRHEDLLRACVVSPHVFAHLVDRLCDVVTPSQHYLKTEASQRHGHRSLAGLLSHLERTNAEEIAALVDVERLVIKECSGTAPWDHRPLVTVLVGQVVNLLGAPDGVLAFDPRSSSPSQGEKPEYRSSPIGQRCGAWWRATRDSWGAGVQRWQGRRRCSTG